MSFNPILVRFQRPRGAQEPLGATVFQSHIGPISTYPILKSEEGKPYTATSTVAVRGVGIPY